MRNSDSSEHKAQVQTVSFENDILEVVVCKRYVAANAFAGITDYHPDFDLLDSGGCFRS